jgi:hypothetical protein
MESGTANLLKMLEERVKELCYQEKWDEAVHAAETAVRKARESRGRAGGVPEHRSSKEAL